MTNLAVIWDMDGVLVDTGEYHFHAWARALGEHNVPFDREKFRETFGMNNAGILQLILGPAFSAEQRLQIGEAKERYFRDDIRNRVQPLPGVREWLNRLQAAGARQAIASSAPQANIDVLIDALGLRAYFHAIVSGADLPGKPHPDTFLLAAQQLEAAPGQCVVVEDAIAGVTAAKRAGMKCIAVTTTNAAEALHAADVIISRLDALSPDAFQQLLAGPPRA